MFLAPQLLALVLERLPPLNAIKTARVSRSFAAAARSLTDMQLAACVLILGDHCGVRFSPIDAYEEPGCREQLSGVASLCACLQSAYAVQISRLDLTVPWRDIEWRDTYDPWDAQEEWNEDLAANLRAGYCEEVLRDRWRGQHPLPQLTALQEIHITLPEPWPEREGQALYMWKRFGSDLTGLTADLPRRLLRNSRGLSHRAL